MSNTKARKQKPSEEKIVVMLPLSPNQILALQDITREIFGEIRPPGLDGRPGDWQNVLLYIVMCVIEDPDWAVGTLKKHWAPFVALVQGGFAPEII